MHSTSGGLSGTCTKDGLISRKVYAEVPPRVEYRLTELGESLMPRVQMLVDWDSLHLLSLHYEFPDDVTNETCIEALVTYITFTSFLSCTGYP